MSYPTVTEQPTIPNTGRILDYWLGGTHHFPPDAGAGDAFTGIYPEFPKVFRILRDYIGRASRYVASEGVTQFIVFGAGVPTQGNVHEAVPEARVLYTDIDPVNVELGRQILADSPNADYAYCDATDLNTLDLATVDRVLGPSARLGLVFVGVAAFMTDEQLKATFDRLYDWAPAGSYMIFDFDSDALSHFPAALEALKAGGAPLYMRTPETIAPLLGRWQLTEDGIVPAEAWRNPAGAQHQPQFMYVCVGKKP